MIFLSVCRFFITLALSLTHPTVFRFLCLSRPVYLSSCVFDSRLYVLCCFRRRQQRRTYTIYVLTAHPTNANVCAFFLFHIASKCHFIAVLLRLSLMLVCVYINLLLFLYILNLTESNSPYPYTMEWISELSIYFDLLVLLKICFPPPHLHRKCWESSVTKREKKYWTNHSHDTFWVLFNNNNKKPMSQSIV